MTPEASPPLLSLAPMQDVTDLAFIKTLEAFGGADQYTTPYFRVVTHTDHLAPKLADMICKNPSDTPIVAQIIGSDPESLARSAKILQEKLPLGGIDLNIGCPAPIVCRKDAGGGMLRNPQKLDKILGLLRDACSCPFSIKTRLGYDIPEEFDDLLPLFLKHSPDSITIHARTVREGYQAPVHPEFVREAVNYLPCPVIANGNIVNTATAASWLSLASPAGLMIGRGAVRNPWIFTQIRRNLSQSSPLIITRKMLLSYIMRLFDETARLASTYVEVKHIHRMKKFMVYILQGLPSELEHGIRRAVTEKNFRSLCEEYLDSDEEVPDIPPSGTKLFSCFESLLG